MNEAQMGRHAKRPGLNRGYINDGKDELGGFHEFNSNSMVRYLGQLKDDKGFLHEIFSEETAANGNGKLFTFYSPGNSFDGELMEPVVIGNIRTGPLSEYQGSKNKNMSNILIDIRNNENEMVYSLKALENGKLTLSRVG